MARYIVFDKRRNRGEPDHGKLEMHPVRLGGEEPLNRGRGSRREGEPAIKGNAGEEGDEEKSLVGGNNDG